MSSSVGLPAEWVSALERVDEDASKLAATLLEVSDAGVPVAVVLPKLVEVFKRAFGDTGPEGFAMPAGLAGLLGGGS